MNVNRPFGVKLIAGVFFLEAAVLVLAAAVGYLKPELQPNANKFIAQRAPYLQDLDLVKFGVMLAPLLAAFDAAKGLGIWFLKRWARVLIVLDLTYRLGEAAVAAVLLWGVDRKMLLSIVSTPAFAIGSVLNVIILGYLLDPDAKRAFGLRDDQSDYN